jgi:hypothetical protein
LEGDHRATSNDLRCKEHIERGKIGFNLKTEMENRTDKLNTQNKNNFNNKRRERELITNR